MLNPGFILRKMTSQDIDEIMQIEQKCFTLPWSRESYRGELKNNFATYLVCDFEGKIAGYGGIWVVFEDAHITNVAVDPDFRQSGMGTALMQELEQKARDKKAQRILLEVRPSNEAALAMYRNLGYSPTGLRQNYYSDNGEDAIIMTKLLF
ncbi:MAG: ribosomal protein S18-alanine N-acetyltransferase [Syntrophomonadaceae bacterium]|nr:ribosomal protein S18-alanine N-acetyltransferase [Syntrophomonadaceae bacterium]MDD3271556.1 ribosomal protein S18-alanine N-acetyltransferase [Syntrophomonadaceae bacterium]MDD3898378.1 ribosomal protein S18-alanine N-acetyltransferase [Syntrophomonadaceae bacterium]